MGDFHKKLLNKKLEYDLYIFNTTKVAVVLGLVLMFYLVQDLQYSNKLKMFLTNCTSTFGSKGSFESNPFRQISTIGSTCALSGRIDLQSTVVDKFF